MLKRVTLAELHEQLAQVEASIAAHPLASERVQRANAIISAHDAADKQEVERQLAEAGLPDLAELGRIQVSGTMSWWRLHRKKTKLEAKIARASSA